MSQKIGEEEKKSIMAWVGVVVIIGAIIGGAIAGCMPLPYGWHPPAYRSGIDDVYSCPEGDWEGRPGQMIYRPNEWNRYYCPVCGHTISVFESYQNDEGHFGWVWE